MRIIDIHAHPVCRTWVQDARNLRLMERSGLLPDDAPEHALLRLMDAGGVQQACLLGPNADDGVALTNELVAQMVASAPTRFIGFLGVDPVGQEASKVEAEIERAAREWGFKGVGEVGGQDLLAPEWEVVYRACVAHGLPLLVHVGIPLPSMLMKYSHPFLLDELALRHPELTIIAAHAGAPWVLETLAVAVRHPNVYLDISALPAIRKELLPVVLTLCVEQDLEDRVLFGSDFPLVDPGQYAGSVRKVQIPPLARWIGRLPALSQAFKRKILGENAARLLSL
jgi:predicted TIM-barrel fold metal-dependent hydrolase